MSPMPVRRMCSWCRGLVDAGQQCACRGVRPGRSGWEQRPSDPLGQRWRGRAWMAIRHQVLGEEPTCYRCGGGGTNADQVDHVDGNKRNNERGNLRRICGPCHAAKTGRESTRARMGGGR